MEKYIKMVIKFIFTENWKSELVKLHEERLQQLKNKYVTVGTQTEEKI